MLHDQARATHALPIISYPVQSRDSHSTAALPFPSHPSLQYSTYWLHLKNIKTNPSNSDVGISSLSFSRSEALPEIQAVVQTIIRRDGKGGGDKCGGGKGE